MQYNCVAYKVRIDLIYSSLYSRLLCRLFDLYAVHWEVYF